MNQFGYENKVKNYGKAMCKVNWKTAARMIISAGLLIWLALVMDWQQLAQVWSRVEPGWILGAVASIVISMLISVQKWKLLLEAQGINLSWPELWQAYWAGLFFNNFLPSSIGGDALRIWWVGKRAGDTPGAATSVITERILATAGLAVTGLIGAALVGKADSRAVSLFVILTVLSLGLMGMLARGSLPRWAQLRQGRIASFLKGMAGHGHKFHRQTCRLARVGILSVAFQIAVVGVNYCIFRSLHIDALLTGDLLYVIPVISVAAMLPLGINGYGLREGAYVVMLEAYRVPAGTAVSASLLFVFLVSLCSLYGGYTWHNYRSEGDRTDVEVQHIANSPSEDEIWK